MQARRDLWADRGARPLRVVGERSTQEVGRDGDADDQGYRFGCLIRRPTAVQMTDRGGPVLFLSPRKR